MIPIEDVGIVLLDDPQDTITRGALNAVLGQNCVLGTLMGIPQEGE